MRFSCIQWMKQIFSVVLVAMAMVTLARASSDDKQGSTSADDQASVAIRLVDPSTAAPLESNAAPTPHLAPAPQVVTSPQVTPSPQKAPAPQMATGGPQMEAGPQLNLAPETAPQPAIVQPPVVQSPVVEKARPASISSPATTERFSVVPIKSVPAQPASPTVAPPTVTPPAVRPPVALLPHSPAKPSVNVDKSLKPIPVATDGPVEIEAASLKNITPGISTQANLLKAWGEAKETRQQKGMTHYLYSIPPFNRIEVIVMAQKVESILIRLEKPFPMSTVAEQLGLTRIRPVLILNDMGEVLGQSYPERGVVLAFEPSPQPSKPSNKVVQIILEAVAAEPFVLRAENNLELHPELTRRDCEQAIKLQPTNARAHWLQARIFMISGEPEKAVASARAAVRLEPENPQYRVMLAQAIGQTGLTSEALSEADKAAQNASDRLHIKARAYCLMGDLLASAATPDYKTALARHLEAIRIADPLADNQHPAIRIAVKKVLIDAHLGAANDIAWGKWKEKDNAVNQWLTEAATLANELIQNEESSDIYRFHVYNRALAVCVGAQGAVDPKPWAERALKQGRIMISKAQDPLRKSQYQWDLGMALYDALQACQLRGDHDTAIKYGELAAGYFEQSRQKQSALGVYMLGRLYFRLGAVCALHGHDHEAAVRWFDKAGPLLEKPLPIEVQGDLGRQGETFVSMGVSYWQAGQKDRAIELTTHGVDLMELAVNRGLLDGSTLIVAYSNLAVMHRKMGRLESAERYETLAANQKNKTMQR